MLGDEEELDELKRHLDGNEDDSGVLTEEQAVPLCRSNHANKDACRAELESLFREKRALIPVDWKGMSDEQKKKAIRSQLFLKEKYEDGKFVKMKARLVADRQMQDALLYTLISLPSQLRLGRS